MVFLPCNDPNLNFNWELLMSKYFSKSNISNSFEIFLCGPYGTSYICVCIYTHTYIYIYIYIYIYYTVSIREVTSGTLTVQAFFSHRGWCRLARLSSVWRSLVNSWIALSLRCYHRLLLTLKHTDVRNSDSNNACDNV